MHKEGKSERLYEDEVALNVCPNYPKKKKFMSNKVE